MVLTGGSRCVLCGRRTVLRQCGAPVCAHCRSGQLGWKVLGSVGVFLLVCATVLAVPMAAWAFQTPPPDSSPYAGYQRAFFCNYTSAIVGLTGEHHLDVRATCIFAHGYRPATYAESGSTTIATLYTAHSDGSAATSMNVGDVDHGGNDGDGGNNAYGNWFSMGNDLWGLNASSDVGIVTTYSVTQLVAGNWCGPATTSYWCGTPTMYPDAVVRQALPLIGLTTQPLTTPVTPTAAEGWADSAYPNPPPTPLVKPTCTRTISVVDGVVHANVHLVVSAQSAEWTFRNVQWGRDDDVGGVHYAASDLGGGVWGLDVVGPSTGGLINDHQSYAVYTIDTAHWDSSSPQAAACDIYADPAHPEITSDPAFDTAPDTPDYGCPDPSFTSFSWVPGLLQCLFVPTSYPFNLMKYNVLHATAGSYLTPMLSVIGFFSSLGLGGQGLTGSCAATSFDVPLWPGHTVTLHPFDTCNDSTLNALRVIVYGASSIGAMLAGAGIALRLVDKFLP